MKLNRVTITGADESIRPQDLLALSAEFPFVEWAILLSSTKEGNPRFPSRTWIDELAALGKSHDLKLAGHICGAWVRNLVVKKDPAVFVERPEFTEYFPRIQLNFSPYDAAQLFLQILRPFKNEFIVQMGSYKRAEKAALINLGRNLGLNLSVLFDRSGGHGVVPPNWPSPFAQTDSSDSSDSSPPSLEMMPDFMNMAILESDETLAHLQWQKLDSVPMGYAGGLGPDTLAEQLPKIAEATGDRTIWIDMESKVRSEDDQQFDLDKVRACLEISKSWVDSI